VGREAARGRDLSRGTDGNGSHGDDATCRISPSAAPTRGVAARADESLFSGIPQLDAVAYSASSEVSELFFLACFACTLAESSESSELPDDAFVDVDEAESSDPSELSEDVAFVAFFDVDEVDSPDESSDDDLAFFAVAFVEGLLFADESPELLDSASPEPELLDFAVDEPASPDPDDVVLDDRWACVAALPCGFFFSAFFAADEPSDELSSQVEVLDDESSDVLVDVTVRLDEPSEVDLPDDVPEFLRWSGTSTEPGSSRWAPSESMRTDCFWPSGVVRVAVRPCSSRVSESTEPSSLVRDTVVGEDLRPPVLSVLSGDGCAPYGSGPTKSSGDTMVVGDELFGAGRAPFGSGPSTSPGDTVLSGDGWVATGLMMPRVR
jgi:hypothetical protein